MSKVPHEENRPNFQSPQQSIFDNVRVGGNLTVRDIIQQIFIGGDSQSQRQEFRKRRDLLKQVKDEVDSRIEQSLHNAVLINLGKEKQPQQVKRPWDVEVKVGNQSSEPLPSQERIVDFFDREAIAGKFLILGTPGSGKTTTLLELAKELVSRAEVDINQPMPVLFNLSSWKDYDQSIAQWLVAELKDKYGVRNDIGENWLKEHELLPLLDGLDELESSERQEKCVQAINHFLESEERSLYLVVCSRSQEYANYQTQLQLNGAIYLQPLSDDQIRDYLAAVRRADPMQTISHDPTLLELVRTPLLLSVTTLVCTEISLEDWQRLNSSKERLQYLLDAYIRRMLTRKIDSKTYFKQNFPTPTKVRFWLIWLAQQLERKSQTEFIIEKMQPSDLLTSNWRKIYRRINDLLLILIFCMVGLLNSGLFLISLVLGMIFFANTNSKFEDGSGSDSIKTMESLRWSWFNVSKNNWKNWLFGGVILGLSFGLFSMPILETSQRISHMLIGGIIGGIIGLLMSGLMGFDIERKSIPNQGMWQTLTNARNAGIVGLICGTTPALFAVLAFERTGGMSIGLRVGLISGLMSWLFIGGRACVQHFILRFILWQNGYIPWNYARFLNYATERMFLQRVGGRYRFIHRLLQEHFAQMELNQE